MANVNIINARIRGAGTYLLLYLDDAGVFRIVSSTRPVGIMSVPVYVQIAGLGNELTITLDSDGTYFSTTAPIQDGPDCVPFYGAIGAVANQTQSILINYPSGVVSAGNVTDTLSNIFTRSGPTQPIFPTSLMKLPPNPGGNMNSGANWEETDYFRIEAEAPFTRVRIWMFSQDTAQTTGWRCIVAPTETGLSDTFTHCYDPTVAGAVNNSLWQTVTFAGGTGTMPANSGQTRQGVLVSDWCTVASVARAGGEGTTRPLLLCRPYHNSSVGGTHTSQNYAGVHTLSAQAFYRRYEVGAKVGNGIDVLSFKPTQVYDDSSSGFPFGVEFDYGLTTAKPVMSLGDSITAGVLTDASSSEAFGWIAAAVMGLSTPSNPYSFASGGSPGQVSTTFFNEANDMLDAGLRPAYIVLPSFTVNDEGNSLSNATVDAYYVKVDALIAKVVAYSPKPKFIGWTGLPRGAYNAASETSRQYAHTQMRNRVTGGSVYKCVEISAAIQDGASPPRLQAIYDSGDGTHPNAAARPVMAALLAAAFP